MTSQAVRKLASQGAAMVSTWQFVVRPSLGEYPKVSGVAPAPFGAGRKSHDGVSFPARTDTLTLRLAATALLIHRSKSCQLLLPMVGSMLQIGRASCRESV